MIEQLQEQARNAKCFAIIDSRCKEISGITNCSMHRPNFPSQSECLAYQAIPTGPINNAMSLTCPTGFTTYPNASTCSERCQSNSTNVSSACVSPEGGSITDRYCCPPPQTNQDDACSAQHPNGLCPEGKICTETIIGGLVQFLCPKPFISENRSTNLFPINESTD